MKRLIILTLLLTLKLTVFSQTDINKSNSEQLKCLPVSTVKMVIKDLIIGDSSLSELKLTNEQVIRLEEKVKLKDEIISNYEIKDSNYNSLLMIQNIANNELHTKIKSTEKQLKNEKSKNKLKTIIFGCIFTIETYFLTIK